jgi:hypothetical protein
VPGTPNARGDTPDHVSNAWVKTTGSEKSSAAEICARGMSVSAKSCCVRCELDPNGYPKGVTVSDAERAGLNIACDAFYGE